MFNELVLQINPTITAIATLLIAFSLVLLVLFSLLMRRAGLIGRPPVGRDGRPAISAAAATGRSAPPVRATARSHATGRRAPGPGQPAGRPEVGWRRTG